MADSTWEHLEQPILEAVAELEDTHDPLGLEAIAEHCGLSVEQVRVGVKRLLPTDLLSGKELAGLGVYDVMGIRLLPRGRQVVQQWPSSDPLEALLQVLSERIAQERDPDERGRLERFRDAAGSISKDVIAGTIVAVGQRMALG